MLSVLQLMTRYININRAQIKIPYFHKNIQLSSCIQTLIVSSYVVQTATTFK